MKKDIGKSVRAQLLNISRNEKISFQTILIRYIHERFLQRLSNSRFRDNFCLKGGALIYSIQRLTARPTRDVDLLGVNIKNDITLIRKVFYEILNTPGYTDAVKFITESIAIKELMENKKYKGVRMTVDVRLDSMKEKLSVDIGFGDVITPSHNMMEYPTLLEENAQISINAYSIETVIAEKFEAMISLSLSNSRMKDFFDVFNFLESKSYDLDILEKAIVSTFSNRGTPYIYQHPLFSEEFTKDKMREKMWKAYLKKIKCPEKIDFEVVLSKIKDVLFPIWGRLSKE